MAGLHSSLGQGCTLSSIYNICRWPPRSISRPSIRNPSLVLSYYADEVGYNCVLRLFLGFVVFLRKMSLLHAYFQGLYICGKCHINDTWNTSPIIRSHQIRYTCLLLSLRIFTNIPFAFKFQHTPSTMCHMVIEVFRCGRHTGWTPSYCLDSRSSPNRRGQRIMCNLTTSVLYINNPDLKRGYLLN